MQCPYCQTENRDDQEACYHCQRDLSMLRLIVNKAKHHFNQALELAEHNHPDEAITEMKNALDLDGSLINARVVLGTLYAKKELFEEARRCWKEALVRDHRYQKAHDYLAKSDSVEQALPTVKRLQRISVGMALVLVLLLVIVVSLLTMAEGRQAPPAGGVSSGSTEASPTEKQLAAQIDQLRQDLLEARDQTRVIRERIGAFERQRIELAEAALANGEAALALQLSAALNESGTVGTAVAPETAQRAARIAGQARQTLADQARAAADDYLAGKTDAAAFERASGQFLKWAADAPEAARIRELKQKVDQVLGERLLTATNTMIANAPLEEAIRAAGDLKTRRPDLAGQIDMTLDLRLDAETTRLAEQVRALTEQGDFAGARRTVDELAQACQAAGRPADAKPFDELRRGIAGTQAARQLSEAQTAVADKQWEKALQLTGAIDAQLLDNAARAQWESLQVEARRRQAEADWQWFQETDPKFCDGRISTEEATRATTACHRTIENLPPSMSYARAPILFYTATAHLKLGEADKAAGLLKDIDAMDRMPDYIRPPIKQFKKAHAKKLGLPVETPKPAAKQD